MPRKLSIRAVSLTTLTLLFLLSACGDAGAPTSPASQAAAGPKEGLPQQADPEAMINRLINELFPQPERSEAHRLFDEVKDAVAEGDSGAAEAAAFELLALMLSTELEEPSTGETAAEAEAELTSLLFDFVGLDPLPPEVVEAIAEIEGGEVDGVVAVAFGDQDNTIVTQRPGLDEGEGFAGTFIPDAALADDEQILVVAREVTTTSTTPCLGFDLAQPDHCFQWERFPDGVFRVPVTVAQCLDWEDDTPRLYRDDGTDVFLLDDQVDPTVLQTLESAGFVCPPRGLDGQQVGGDGGLFPRLARLLTAPVRALVDPPYLWAANRGLAGLTTSYSNFGWAIPVEIVKQLGEGAQVAPGGAVLLQVALESTHEVLGLPVEGVSLSFEAEDGVLAAATPVPAPVIEAADATVTSDVDGLAAATWTLPTATGTYTATVTVEGADNSPQSFTVEVLSTDIPLSDEETIFNFDLTNLSPAPPYRSISWRVTFRESDPVDGADVLITNVYGGPSGTELVQTRNDTELIAEGGTVYGWLETANPLFDPLLDGIFSFGLVMTSGTAVVAKFEVCGNAVDSFEQACTPRAITWSTLPNPSGGRRLDDVWGIDESTFWVVGEGGLILHTTDGGATWIDQSPETFSELDFRGIWTPDGQNLWVAADDPSSTETTLGHPILHSSDGGTSWILQHSIVIPGGGIPNFEIWGFSTTDVWVAAGASALLHYDGETWTNINPGLITLYLDVWGSGPQHVFGAAADGIVETTDGGVTWTTAPDVLDSGYEGIWGSGPDDVYAVGRERSAAGMIAHNDGTGWQMDFRPAVTMFDVWGTGPEDVFAVGQSGSIYHQDGSGWTLEPAVTASGLLRVWVAPGPTGDVVAVGNGGIIVHGTRP